MRDRAWRRAQARRIIRKRQRIIRVFWQDKEYEPVPGFLRKWNFTCSCGMCKISGYWSKCEKRHRENARATKLSDYAEL